MRAEKFKSPSLPSAFHLATKTQHLAQIVDKGGNVLAGIRRG
jgi:hypothetical protein